MRHSCARFVSGVVLLHALLEFPSAAAVVRNVIRDFSVSNQAGPTIINLIYRDNGLTSPLYTFHLPDGTDVSALTPSITLYSEASVSPPSGAPINFTPPIVPFLVTFSGQTRTNLLRCVVQPPASATSGCFFDMGNPTLRDIWVDPVHGSDSAGNGTTRAQAYRTINRAWADVPSGVRFATNGYRLMLCSGSYTNDRYWFENRFGTYQHPLIFQAADGPNTVVIRYDMHFFTCNYIYLIGINTEPSNGGDGLHFDACDYILVRDCVIKAGPGTQRLGKEGLKLNQCAYFFIERSEICNAYDNAFDAVASRYGHVKNCRIHDADDWAAYVKGGSSDIAIAGNEVYNGGVGGVLAGQGTGGEYFTAPWIHYQAYNIKVINNVIRECNGAGIGVNGGYNILFAHNTLYRVGANSHGIEVTFGGTGLDNARDQDIADTFNDWGGWMHPSTSGYQWTPNRNVYIYNNILFNPMPYRSQWQHFEFGGSYSGNSNTNIPNPAVSDANLQIKGNIIWNGPPNLDLGIGPGTGCQPTNPTCNAILLESENHINTLQPQLASPASGDFRPVLASVSTAIAYDIPPFPGGDAPPNPPTPAGNLTNVVERERGGAPRYRSWPPGAYTAGSSMMLRIGHDAGGEVALDLLAETGYAYRVETSTGLNTNWAFLYSINPAQRTNRFAVSTNAIPTRFFRAVLEP